MSCSTPQAAEAGNIEIPSGVDRELGGFDSKFSIFDPTPFSLLSC